MTLRHLPRSTRLQCVERLVELVAAEVAEHVRWPERVQVLDHDPGGNQLREAIFVIAIRGNREATLLSGQVDQITGDDFTVTIMAMAAADGMTAADARDRADEFYQAVSLVVNGADYASSLADFVTDDGNRPWLTEFGEIDGPDIDPAGDTGHIGWVRMDVRIATQEFTA